jgi:hypothetical protein
MPSPAQAVVLAITGKQAEATDLSEGLAKVQNLKAFAGHQYWYWQNCWIQ